MKKLFFYAAAVVAMLAGCQKSEISGTQAIDDSQPAAIQFGIDAPSLSNSQTRAAVTEWNNSEVYVYGLRQEGRTGTTVAAPGAGRYNTTTPFINNYPATAVSGITSVLEVYDAVATAAAGVNVPYFYEEGQTYDFFGYHLGSATPGEVDKTVPDQITIGVTIDGSQDVMVAYADKVLDIQANATVPMGVDDVYSAWAARRKVHPTLKFQHALSRFNIIVRGMNDLSQNVTIMGVKVAAQNKGKLVVVDANNALGYTGEGSDVELELMTDEAQPAVYTDDPVVFENTNPAGGANACFMLAPNKDAFTFTVSSINSVYKTELPDQEVTVTAADLVKSGHGLLDEDERESAGATVFEAGKAYNIYINVYGPEQITITAELTEWKEGGDFVFDPDVRPGSGQNVVDQAEAGNIVKAMAVQSDEASYNTLADMLGDAWKANPNNAYEAAVHSLPWVSATFDKLTEAKKMEITVKGVQTITPIDGNWPEYELNGNVMTLTCPPSSYDCGYIGFEAKRELGFTDEQIAAGELAKVKIVVKFLE